MLKKYWIELLTFGFIATILFVCLNPDYTFINKAVDSIGYLYSAQYMYPSYHTSPPLYLLTGHFFLMLPFGTDAWKMGLMSVFSTLIACYFIFLVIRRLIPNKRIYPILGVLIYGTSALVISQSTIVNTYAITTMLSVGAYYFAVTKHWKLMGLIIGIGLAVHLLMGFVFLIMLVAFKDYRKNWKALLITFSFGVFYLYIPLTNREPFMWFPDPEQVNTIWAFVSDTFSTIMMLIGKLSIWDLPKRTLDIICILGVSLGILAFIPIIYYFIKNKVLKNVLFWLIIVPISLFLGELDMNTYDYMMIAMPFLAIVACIGLDLMVQKYQNKARAFGLVTLVVVIGFGGYNLNYFDVGRTLDKDLSASNLYYNEFSKLPDNAIFMPNYAWEWEAIYKYNADYGKHIYPICIDILPSEMYQQQLRKDGIKLDSSSEKMQSVLAYEVATSIVRLNDNVWTTVSTNPSTFGTEVVQTNHNTDLIVYVDKKFLENLSANPKVSWKPYNPYDVITTSITVEQWRYVILSNKNVMFFVGLASVGLILNWFLFIAPKRKVKNENT